MIGKSIGKLLMGLHIFIYRQSKGRQAGFMRGMPVLLLTTIGRKSGKQRTVPIMYLRDSENYVVIASNGGRDSFPAWFLNLKSHPQVTIEVDGVSRTATAEQANPEEKQRLWPQLVEKAAFFEEYRKKTTRDIPMVIVRPEKV